MEISGRYLTLFEEESLLFNRGEENKISSYEKLGFLSEDDKLSYQVYGPDQPIRCTALCGPYRTSLKGLQNSIREIVNNSLADGCEYGSLIISETTSPRLIKNISFTECTGSISPTRLICSTLRKDSYKGRYIGLIHSHPREDLETDSIDAIGDFPSIADFTVHNKVLVGVIRPEKIKLTFYKIKAPCYSKFLAKYEDPIRSLLPPQGSRWIEEIKRFCLCEEVPLDSDYNILVPNRLRSIQSSLSEYEK
jgi:hypothetical protein